MLRGGLSEKFHTRGITEEGNDKVMHRGILFSSGVIAGEALMSVGLACITALGVQSLELGLSTGLVTILSIAAAVFIVWMFHKFTRPTSS